MLVTICRNRFGSVVTRVGTDFAGAAADAVNVVVDETELHGRFDRFVCLGHLALQGDLDFLHVELVGHGRSLCVTPEDE
jgi:hypothetical protein